MAFCHHALLQLPRNRIEAMPMTLSDLQGHSSVASLSNVTTYSCAAVDNILTDTKRREVRLR